MAAKFKYVTLPQGQWRSGQEDAKITEQLNEWVTAGWEPISVTRPAAIGPVGFLFRKDAP
jgi:hypothetical protein